MLKLADVGKNALAMQLRDRLNIYVKKLRNCLTECFLRYQSSFKFY